MFDLATLVVSAEADDNVYVQESIKRIIDYQFTFSCKQLKWQFFFYTFCYYLPLISMNFYSNTYVEMTFQVLGIIVQSYFFHMELIQLKVLGTEYFESFWNLTESLQYFCYIAFIVLRIQSNYMETPDFY